jgi:hypothetical protein
MKRVMLLSLALILLPLAHCFAAATERDFSFTTSSTYAFGPSVAGIGLTLDYNLDSRSSLFLNYNAFANAGDSLGTVGYKYWLTKYQTIRPWVQAGAGYLWNKSTKVFPEPNHEGREREGDFQLSFGGGARLELTERFGLDAGVNLVKARAPWRWGNSTKLINTSLGVDYLF